MSVLFAHLLFATAQCQAKFALQLVQVRQFPLYVDQLFLQPVLHRRTRLQAIAPKP
jgi:hypothetical protein